MWMKGAKYRKDSTALYTPCIPTCAVINLKSHCREKSASLHAVNSRNSINGLVEMNVICKKRTSEDVAHLRRPRSETALT